MLMFMEAKGIGPPGTRVIGGCKPPNLGARDQVQVFGKSSAGSFWLEFVLLNTKHNIYGAFSHKTSSTLNVQEI